MDAQSTDLFKNAISAELQKKADSDPLFADNFNKENKNIDDCIKFIINQVKKSKRNGFAEEEIYELAAHYYNVDNVEVGSDIKCRIVMNHKIELTETEKQEARKAAFNAEVEAQREKIKKKAVSKSKNQAPVESLSLFS